MSNSDWYKLKGKSRNVSQLQEIELPGKNIFTRKSIIIELINHFDRPTEFAGLHVGIIYQKKAKKSDPWPSKYLELDDPILKGNSIKITLNTEQSSALFEKMKDAFAIADGGIEEGSRTILKNVSQDQILITDKNRVGIFQNLLKASSSDEILALLENDLPKDISSKLIFNKIHDERLKVIKEFEISINEEKGEEYWQQLLKNNKWIFGSSYIEILDERRIDIHDTADFPLSIEGGFMDIAEIKKPEQSFWQKQKDGSYYLYREKFLVPSVHLQGAIAQCVRYIHQAEKRVDSIDFKLDHSDTIPLKPKGIVVIGRSNSWKKEEWETFRLLNDEHHGIEMITFDHLLGRAKRALNLFEEQSE